MIEEIEISLKGAGPNFTPRPVFFRGENFRSTLEARYVVFFDILGLRWLYEPQTWKLEPKWYKPDFYLPDMGVWGEVKPRDLNQEEMTKALGLALASRQNVILLVGLPTDGPYKILRPDLKIVSKFLSRSLRFSESGDLIFSESKVLEAAKKASQCKFVPVEDT